MVKKRLQLSRHLLRIAQAQAIGGRVSNLVSRGIGSPISLNVTAAPDGERLAAAFLESALPTKAARDAAHLAIAAVGGVKYLLTWNCNHLANAQILDRFEPIATVPSRLPGSLYAGRIDGRINV